MTRDSALDLSRSSSSARLRKTLIFLSEGGSVEDDIFDDFVALSLGSLNDMVQCSDEASNGHRV